MIARADKTTSMILNERGLPFEVADDEPMSLRRWEGARTNRLNKAHWAFSNGQSLNVDISTYAKTLQERCEFEAYNNSMLAGVIKTHAQDIVGANEFISGPIMQVKSDNREFNKALQAEWMPWWNHPEITGRWCGPELLVSWHRAMWTNGEYLGQLAIDSRARTNVKIRVVDIHPRNLATPSAMAGDTSVQMGIRHDDFGRPITYWINSTRSNELLSPLNQSFHAVDAENMIHGFELLEAGQIRGVPLMAPVLQVAADLRDFDTQTLDAARAAADHAILLFTDHPDAEPVNIGTGNIEVERRQINALPRGWKAEQITPQHPSLSYAEYRTERARDIGRPVCMPVIMVKLDSGNHNMSSARFDSGMYRRAIYFCRHSAECHAMDRLAEAVMLDSGLLGKFRVDRDEVEFRWTWPSLPTNDPDKDAAAAERRRRNGTSSLIREMETSGMTIEEIVADERFARDLFLDAGLDYPEPVRATGRAAAPERQQQAGAPN